MKTVMHRLLLAALVLVIACEDEKQVTDLNAIEVRITNTETYEYHTGMGGDEQGASITRQAQHYSISEIVRDASTNYEPVYRYKSEPGYVGIEEVILTLSDHSLGTDVQTEQTEITIYISVTD